MERSGVLFIASWVVLAGLSDPAASSTRFVHVSPVPGSKLVSPENNIVLRAADAVDSELLERSGVRVVGSSSGLHSGRLELSSDSRTIVFLPDHPFHLGERVVVRAAPLRERTGSGPAEIAFDFTIAPRRVSAPIPHDPWSEFPAGAHVMTSAPEPPTSTLAGPLPPDYPTIFLDLSLSPEPGGVFLGLRAGGPHSNLVIIDNLGQPLFYRRTPAVGTDFTLQQGLLTYFDGALRCYLALDAAGAVVDSFRMGNGYLTDFHDMRLMPNGHALLMAYDPQPVRMDSVVPGGNPNAVVTGLVIQEIDADKNVIFQWRSWDHFQITDAASCMVNFQAATIDYVHANSMEIDFDGNILISSRHMNEITKIDRTTGNVIWRFGFHAVNNQFTILGESRGFSHQHDARRLPNGHLTLYDNGNCLTPQYSRGVEYALDEINKIATQVWEYRDSPDVFALGTGNVQRRASGSTMIGWGFAPKVTDLHPDDSKAFEVSFPSGTRTYRAFRFPWSTTRFSLTPSLLDFGTVALGDSALRVLTVHNDWSQSVEIDGFVSTSEWFRIWDPMPVTIPTGESADVNVWFKALGTGSVTGTLYARSVSNTELIAQTVGMSGAGPPTSVEDRGAGRSLSVHPSPSRGPTRVAFDLTAADQVRIQVLDVQGRVRSTLADREFPAGRHELPWNAGVLPAGLYFVRLERTGIEALVRRVALVP